MFSFAEIQQHIATAHMEAEWVWAGIEQRVKDILHVKEKKRVAKVQRREFRDMFHAAAVLSDPRLSLSPEQIQSGIRAAALQELQRAPQSFTETRDQTMTAAYVGARRWGSRTSPAPFNM